MWLCNGTLGQSCTGKIKIRLLADLGKSRTEAVVPATGDDTLEDWFDYCDPIGNMQPDWNTRPPGILVAPRSKEREVVFRLIARAQHTVMNGIPRNWATVSPAGSV